MTMERPPEPDSIPEPDEVWFASQIGRLDVDAADADDAALTAIRERLLQDSDAGLRILDTKNSQNETGATPRVSIAADTDTRSNSMLALATRLVLAVTTAAVALVFWISGSTPTVAAAPHLGRILESTTSAQSLVVQLERDGESNRLWLTKSGRVRWERTSNEYLIADGSSLWRIDEEANTVRRETAGPHGIAAAGNLDLLGLLGVDEEERAVLLEAKPIGMSQHQGRECRLYRKELKLDDQTVLVEAFTDPNSNELRGLALWASGMPQRNNLPLAELQLLARDVTVDEATFKVSKSLTEDGRIGKVTDLQGIVSLRPLMRRRWTPICRQMLLRPKDVLRTDVRGANAVTVSLTSDVQVIVGPGSLVEFEKPHSAIVHYGEVQVRRSKQAEGVFTLTGPGAGSAPVEKIQKPGRTLFRASRNGGLERVKRKPVWLGAYEGSTNNESIGSLIANVNGANTPLTVGYHKVNVEIRDQIARTTIEESFVNHTDNRLEGIFHFPLPQDASISGFGMWIGGELIEADVVEKQRAREIYETILREKRDPGLLEWTGGNVFKARVFPIEANSEKRIRIVYTQVLPMRANRYRYSYGLRSEMLQTTPLRELSINVLVNSALPLKSVKSPTHQVTADATTHSASLEFSRQEYTPTRDFELVCEIDGGQSDVVMIPHRRGEDGYFLAQLTPPAPDGNWQRELLPDGDPLELFLVCDTSGSMDRDSRRSQSAFVTSVLSSLGEQDRFNVAVSDVDTHWLFDEPVSVGDEKPEKVRDWLSDRVSLGWTDLDRAFGSIAERAGPNTHVIYIGDGIVTAHDADPQAFVNRLRRLFSKETKGTFHAVSTGSRFESVVLRSIASVGRGSTRQITGEMTPQAVALELLNEIAQPGLTDLNVEFRGLQVAAVYPERLPNLAAGTQQIVIGRFLPQGDDQKGEIIVTGKRGGEEVRYAAKVSLNDAESGNSFIPRLWARQHLDRLLQQGRSQVIRDEIISLSEEFHIMTPYTSLLVLESDADRERFGVKRRYQMRDGERFFADGRDNARYELLQQQMRRAGDWRIAMRRRILLQLAQLGRPRQLAQAIERISSRGFALRGQKEPGDDSRSLPEMAAASEISGEPDSAVGGVVSVQGKDAAPLIVDAEEEFKGLTKNLEEAKAEGESDEEYSESKEDLGIDPDDGLLRGESDPSINGPMDEGRSTIAGGELVMGRSAEWQNETVILGQPVMLTGGRAYGGGRRASMGYLYWVDQLFPTIPGPPAPAPDDEAKPEGWSDEALALSRSLLRIELFKKLQDGLDIRRTTTSFDPNWERTIGQFGLRELYSNRRWLKRTISPGSQTIVNWCDNKQRSLYSKTYQLGRTRASKPQELQIENVSVGLRDFSIEKLHRTYANYKAAVEKVDDATSQLILTHGLEPRQQSKIVMTIDTGRQVVVKYETYYRGTLQQTSVYSNFKEIAGRWWALAYEYRNAKGQVTSKTTQTVTPVARDAFDKAVDTELAGLADVQLIQLPAPSIPDAEAALADGSADFDDRLMLLLRDASIQNWDGVFKHLVAIEELAPGKHGLRWVRMTVLNFARRHEELRQLLLAESGRLNEENQEDYVRAQLLMQQYLSVLDSNERLGLIDRLRPIYEAQPGILNAKQQFLEIRVRQLEALRRTPEALEHRRQLAELAPWDQNPQGMYARALARSGDYEAAYAWIDEYLKKYDDRYSHPNDYLRQMYCDLLAEQERAADLAEYLAKWVALDSEYGDPYSRYLSALVFADRSNDANRLALQWMTDGRVAGEVKSVPAAKLNAAIQYAVGRGYQLYQRVIDPRWRQPLTETARFFLKHEKAFRFAAQILEARYFRDTDEADQLRREVFELLKTDSATLPVGRIDYFIRWAQATNNMRLIVVPEGRAQVYKAESSEARLKSWRAIAATLKERWAAAKDIDEKTALGNAVSSIYRISFADSEYLPFLRERIKQATDRYRLQFTQNLFNVLLSRKWNEAEEAEAFALLDRLSEAKTDAEKLQKQIPSLLRLVDRMLQARFQADLQKFQDEGHPETLTRTDLRAKHESFRSAAREALSDRLHVEAAEREDSLLAAWLRMERTWLDVKLNRKLGRAAKECWHVLGDGPVEPGDGDQADADKTRMSAPTPETSAADYFNEVLRRRALMTLGNLTARSTAKAGDRDRLLKHVATGTTLGDQNAATYWKTLKFMLLVAYDNPQGLERDLRNWIQTDKYVTRWRRVLGYLLAERGKIAEAIALFEIIEKDSRLSAGDYYTLANWYLVSDQREHYEKAQLDIFRAMPEYKIRNWIRGRVRRWQRDSGAMPSEMDERVLFAFDVLFEKASSPRRYVRELNDFYTATRDFRLLRMVPEIVLGRTPQQVYNVLNSLHGTVFEELRKESTADEILNRLETIRAEAGAPIDHRALDLLEALVERKSSEVLNQPGSHVAKSVAALKRAFERDWASGERRQMADFLASLGKITQRELVAEQLRELGILFRQTERGSQDRLHIGWAFSRLQFYGYEQRREAITRMDALIREFEQAHPDGLPADANGAVSGYIAFLQSERRHAEGEQVLKRLLKKPFNEGQARYLKERLVDLYASALENQSRVSLGEGNELLKNLVPFVLQEVETENQNLRYQLLYRLIAVFNGDQAKKLPACKDEVRRFAFETLPRLLTTQTKNYRRLVERTERVVFDVIGPRDALVFLLDRFESWPARMQYTYDNAWQRLGSRLGSLRLANGKLGNLEPRLLKIVADALRNDLTTRNSRNRSIYTWGTYFWEEKAGLFLEIAEEVLAEHDHSERFVTHIASYVFDGLRQYDRGIEMLSEAHSRNLLGPQWRYTLVVWLHQHMRWGESIALLEPLIEEQPERMDHRVYLITAFNKTDQPRRLRELLSETDEFFRQKGRWTESNISALNLGCIQNGLHEDTIKYSSELIPLHQRTRRNRGIGNSVLSDYYIRKAQAHSALGQTKEAVDAAAGAVVSWGRDFDNRSRAVETLVSVVGKARDLDGYVAERDREVKRSGQDSPLIRLAIARAYMAKEQFGKAITQLQSAVELQPTNREAHQALLDCYRSQKDHDAIVGQLLTLLDFDRHNLKLYNDLAAQLEKDESMAERAATTIVEAAPSEAEHHTALAKLRESQERWDAAILHWQHAAELRSLEPDGLLGLIEAQIKSEMWNEARVTLDKLAKKEWPSRFGDLSIRIRELRKTVNEQAQ